MTNIPANLATIKNQIHDYERYYQRAKNTVALLAVSKNQSIEKILSAIEAGQKDFGENYLQEALPKIATLADKEITWHFIGPIQSNKTKKIAEQFDWVHSVSSQRIAEQLNKHRPAHRQPLNICLQVNVSQAASKSGLELDAVLPLAKACHSLPNLTLRGLMTIPDQKIHLIDQRAEYYKLRLMRDFLISEGISIDTLSMGMSQDMRAAIAEDATIVRIGTALFGNR